MKLWYAKECCRCRMVMQVQAHRTLLAQCAIFDSRMELRNCHKTKVDGMLSSGAIYVICDGCGRRHGASTFKEMVAL